MRCRTLIVTVLISLTLTGCISLKFAYNRLDWFTVLYVSNLFDLDREQKDALRLTVARNLEWHRTNQLPKYAAFCRELDAQVDGGITAEMLELRYQELLVIWDEFLVHVLPDTSAFLQSLTDRQIADFLDNVEKDNEELWEDYGGRTPEERLERRDKSIIKGVERFTGRLNRDQKALIRSYTVTLHDNTEEWLTTRRAWQVEFRDLLQSRPAEPVYSDRLARLLLQPNAGDSDDYRRKVEENRQMIFRMFEALVLELTDRQRARASERLNSFAEDFEMLAEQL